MTLAAVARIARVGRAAVAAWRRRHGDFPAPVGGTAVSPLLDPDHVAAWLLAHGKIAVPYVPDHGTLLLRTAGGGTRTVRLEAPEYRFAKVADAEDTVGGWVVETDADALMTAAEYPSGAGILRLSVPGEPAVAVRGGVTLTARSEARRGRVWVALWWRAGLRGEAGRTEHAEARPVREDGCPCRAQDCGGITVTASCPVHGTAAAPALTRQPVGGIRCAELRGRGVRGAGLGSSVARADMGACGQARCPGFLGGSTAGPPHPLLLLRCGRRARPHHRAAEGSRSSAVHPS
ncbi:hypothetical protein [Streptomyces sp. NPDC097619]|uniref:hypothetical protein n=1 Tax=Streptomyces sp. NPDC097619 TaxID=3157228 RepID=UPI003318FCED